MINPKDYLVILAEDNRGLREVFTELLLEKCFSVDACANGQELLERLLGFSGDFSKVVVVSDTNMPNMEGDEACRTALERVPGYRRTIIFGMSDDSGNERYWKGVAVAHHFLHKGSVIDNPQSKSNLAEMVLSGIDNILNNSFYRLPDGSYRRDIR